MRELPRRVLIVLAAACLVACGALLSGCAWTGKGKDVAAAIEKSSQFKTRAFMGSMKMKITGAPQSNTPSEIRMIFDGVSDSTDPNNPRLQMRMTSSAFSSSGGESLEMTMPGDGKIYTKIGGQAVVITVPQGQNDQYSLDTSKVLLALGDAVGGFKESQPMTNVKGGQVPAITATVDKEKLCGSVMKAFGDAINRGSGAGELGKSFGSGASDLSGFCKMLLKEDPRVWFGIENGALTDVALHAELGLPMGMGMNVEVQYHEYDQGKPVGEIKPPPGAVPVTLEQLQAGAVQQ